jgi:hypothetical protein
MIFRHFTDTARNRNSYLIACPKTREAALIDPIESCMSQYESMLAERGLHLAYTLQTENDRLSTHTSRTLRKTYGSRQVVPFRAAHFDSSNRDSEEGAKPGSSFILGDLKIEAIQARRLSEGELSYRISNYLLSSQEILIDDSDSAKNPTSPNAGSESIQASSPFDRISESRKLVRNLRTTRSGVSIERLIMEDLHTSLVENTFSPKEARVVKTYLTHLEDNGFCHPTASDLSEMLGDVDRTAVHVLVHNIRWKQIESERLPMVLEGQTSKWLRELQTKPTFTDHEKEFLSAYLQLVERNQRPPSGPDVAKELAGERSVQWIRKRAHTIRRKQKEFNQPILILNRKSPEISHSRRYMMTRRPESIDHQEMHYTA